MPCPYRVYYFIDQYVLRSGFSIIYPSVIEETDKYNFFVLNLLSKEILQ